MEQERSSPEALRRDGEAIAGYMRQAITECMEELNPNIAEALRAAFFDKPSWPNPELLAFLDTKFPGFAEKVVARCEEIQQEKIAGDTL